jgi:hypothetical protein
MVRALLSASGLFHLKSLGDKSSNVPSAASILLSPFTI